MSKGKKIKIELSSQRLKAYADAKEVFDFPCVTGDAGHPTPKGKFSVLQKERIRRSRKYNSQMNYALQLTTSGIFIHESYNRSENPLTQSPFDKVISDTAGTAVSRLRAWFPSISESNISFGNINLLGSHGCIRLAHSDAVALFNWATTGTGVEIRQKFE